MFGQVDLGQRVRLAVMLDYLLAGTTGARSRPRVVATVGRGRVHRRNDDAPDEGDSASEGRRPTKVLLCRPYQINRVGDRHRSVRELLVFERFENGPGSLTEHYLLVATGGAGGGSGTTTTVVPMVRVERGS